MEKAARLLRSSQLEIKQIASLLGYDDIFHFSKLFKNHYQVPPGKFRGRHRPGRDAGSMHMHYLGDQSQGPCWSCVGDQMKIAERLSEGRIGGLARIAAAVQRGRIPLLRWWGVRLPSPSPNPNPNRARNRNRLIILSLHTAAGYSTRYEDKF